MPSSPAKAPGGQISRFPADRLGDAELVEAVARGDGAALGGAWDRYSSLIRAVLRGALGPDASVDDLLQEVFLAFFRGAGSIADPRALRSYLIGVAVRHAAMEIRRRKVRRWVTLTPSGELPELPVGPTDSASSEALRALYRVLDQLSTRRRLSFVLRHVEGLELVETARAMGVSESTVKRELIKAREQLLALASREPALVEYLKRFEQGRPW